jgi:hypothetical protein
VVSELSREQWAACYAEINSDQESSASEMDALYQHGLAEYDSGGRRCASCGKGPMLTWADLPSGATCTGCMGEWLARQTYGPEAAE